MFSAIKQFFAPSDTRLRAHQAYIAVVEQSRRPVFYQQWGVEDGLDGRFDMIALHLSLLLERLESEAETAEAPHFMRFVSETFFADMDRSLREMGVGDTGVGPRVKKMAQAFYGRRKAYAEAQDMATMGEALKRNMYREKTVDETGAGALAAYALRCRDVLAQQPVAALLQGRVSFSE